MECKLLLLGAQLHGGGDGAGAEVGGGSRAQSWKLAGDAGGGGGSGGQGRAVQVDPIKPNLKLPGTKRLKLKYDTIM